MAPSAEAAAEVVDILIAEPTEDETRESFPPSSSSSASALGATHLLRSPAGARVARRLAAKATGVRRRGDARVGDASDSRGTLVPDRLGEVQRTPTRVSGGGGGDARRRAGVAGAHGGAHGATGASAPDRPDADVPGDVVRHLAGRHPHGKLAFRRALADAALARAESAAREGLTVDTASVVAASLRLFSAAVSPPGSAARVRRSVSRGAVGKLQPSMRARVRVRARRRARRSRGGGGGGRVFDARDAVRRRGTRGGGFDGGGGDDEAVRRRRPREHFPPVAAVRRRGRAPRRRRGTHLVHQAQDGRRAGHRRRAQRVQGRRARRRRRRDFLQNSFFSKNSGLDGARPGAKEKQAGGEADASTADPSTAPPTPTPASPTTPTTTASAHDVLDVACGVLSALPDDGTAGSLDELAILACALRAWPSTTSPPDAAATRDGVAFIRGLGFESLEPVAARFALLEAGGYRQHAAGTDVTAAETAAAASAGARVSSSASARVSSSAKKSVAVTRDDAAKKRSSASPAFGSALPSLRASVRSDSAVGAANRRVCFSATCATRWARRAERPRRRGRRRFVRSRRRRQGGSSPPPPRRARAAAELLVAWIDARVVAEGEGAWETRALAAAASELVEMDDPALAPAVTALASSRATADPAAVVDAILLGRLVPHADAVAEDDVKTRLPAWTPRGVDSERVRGVSRANEDRLRRWATAWTRDAYASAESLLAKGGGRADESAYVSAGRAKTTRVRNPPPILSRASSNRRRVRPRFPCPRTCSGSSRRSRRNARGSRRARNGARRVSRGWAG